MQKITQRNTWDLKLIDHLSALVQGDDDEDDQTNFQKASPSQLSVIVFFLPRCHM